MSTVALMAAEQAARFTGKTLPELTQALAAMGSESRTVPGMPGRFYLWDDCVALKGNRTRKANVKHRTPEADAPAQAPARRTPAKKPAPAPAPEPVPAPAPEPAAPPVQAARGQRSPRKGTDTAAVADTAAQALSAAVATKDAIPPYILEPDRLVTQLSQHGKGDLIHIAKDLGIQGPYGFRRAQIARDIVVRQCELWRAQHPNADVQHATDELAQRRKAKERKAPLPRRSRGETLAAVTAAPMFSDGGQ